SGPLIRSIPQNRLSRLDLGSRVGGEQFVSGNLTLSFPLVHRALIPDELRTNPEFRELLSGQLNSARRFSSRYWRAKDPAAVTAAVGLLAEAVQEIGELRDRFDAISGNVTSDQRDRFEECDFDLGIAEGLADDAENKPTTTGRFLALTSLAARDDDG